MTTTLRTSLGSTTDSHPSVVICRPHGFIKAGDMVFNMRKSLNNESMITVVSDVSLIDSAVLNGKDIRYVLNHEFVGIAITDSNAYHKKSDTDDEDERITIGVSGVYTTHFKHVKDNALEPGNYVHLGYNDAKTVNWHNRPETWRAPDGQVATSATAIRFIQADEENEDDTQSVFRVELCKQNLAIIADPSHLAYDTTKPNETLAGFGGTSSGKAGPESVDVPTSAPTAGSFSEGSGTVPGKKKANRTKMLGKRMAEALLAE